MDKYTIVVMDYGSAEVRVYHLDYEPENVEDWLVSNDENWSSDQCYWMGGKDITITIKTGGN